MYNTYYVYAQLWPSRKDILRNRIIIFMLDGMPSTGAWRKREGERESPLVCMYSFQFLQLCHRDFPISNGVTASTSDAQRNAYSHSA